MSRVEAAIEKVRHLSEPQAEALLEWLDLRENPEALRATMDAEIELGLRDLRRGEKVPGPDVHAEIREMSREFRYGTNITR